jgi:hypothetical protein
MRVSAELLCLPMANPLASVMFPFNSVNPHTHKDRATWEGDMDPFGATCHPRCPGEEGSPPKDVSQSHAISVQLHIMQANTSAFSVQLHIMQASTFNVEGEHS